MIQRLLLFFFVTGFSINAFGFCLNPVSDEFLVVTKYPKKVLDFIPSQYLKTGPVDSIYIYNHEKNFISHKINPSHQKINIEYSTLVLTLNKDQIKHIEKISDTYISQNCFVETLENNDTNPLFTSEPFYSSQWGLQHFLKDLDLSQYTNLNEVIVAVSDTGFDMDHIDLKESLWINDKELNGRPGFDDDGNGCIDDIYGCDVTAQTGNIGINTYKSNLIDHGTHVAGIIAANNKNLIGISGSTLHTKLMLIKSFSSKRKTTAADLIKSIYYAVDNNASIINCSWGTGTKPTMAEFNAFEYARKNNVIAVVAAGNSATYASRTSPAGLTNVFTVGSHNSRNQLSTFSNFGDSVDILAPGGDGVERRNESILSLGTNSGYINKKGTSMSTPFVSAALANLKSIYPNLNRNELINIVLLSSSKTPVQGYFDPKYTDELHTLDFPKSLELAEQYLEGIYTENLNYEPKEIIKPTNTSVIGSDPQDRSPSAENNGSGCSKNNLLSEEASFINWLWLLLPFLWLNIKKRTLK